MAAIAMVENVVKMDTIIMEEAKIITVMVDMEEEQHPLEQAAEMMVTAMADTIMVTIVHQLQSQPAQRHLHLQNGRHRHR